MTAASIRLYIWWLNATTTIRDKIDDARRDERGDVNATTVMIVLLVVGAITAGGIITAKLVGQAKKIPDP